MVSNLRVAVRGRTRSSTRTRHRRRRRLVDALDRGLSAPRIAGRYRCPRRARWRYLHLLASRPRAPRRYAGRLGRMVALAVLACL